MTNNNDHYTNYIIIIQCLIQVVDKKHYLKKKHADFHQNPHYFWDITKQTLRWYFRYLEVTNQLLTKPLKRKHRSLELLIIIGLVRIDHIKEPDHFIVKHSVELAKKMNYQWAAGLVNKVLRRYLEEKETFHNLYKTKQSLIIAHPGWMIKAIKNSWPNQWLEIVVSNQAIPVKWLNVYNFNECGKLKEKYEGLVSESGLIDTALKLNNQTVLSDMINHQPNIGYIQDLSAQMMHLILKQLPSPGKVLDACAAPGGKSFILLRDFPNIHLTCADIDPGRLNILKENLSSYTKQNKIDLLEKDWCSGESGPAETYDLIMLDAPCSGSGVVKRHPEKKFNPWDLNKLCSIQKVLLNKLWAKLEVGGHMIYSTCSILKEENSLQIGAFLSESLNAKTVDVILPAGFKDEFGWQILPTTEMDGHYFMVLKKLC
ncbi:MAG: transcription antitermination factor NusB [Pseudomonadota bacterium]|nr:transcription antitermination factor NusB [Pseudomonadota bacterium]